MRESSFPISYFVGLMEFLFNVMPIMFRNFYAIINLYTIRPTVAKNINVETIRQHRNFDTDSDDNFYPNRIIIYEWEYLEAIASSKFIM